MIDPATHTVTFWPARFVGGPHDGRVEVFRYAPAPVWKVPARPESFVSLAPLTAPTMPEVHTYELVRPGDAITFSWEMFARLGRECAFAQVRAAVDFGGVNAATYLFVK